ncbi:hypothetical protein ACLOJK_006548 [Asimina triloba]
MGVMLMGVNLCWIEEMLVEDEDGSADLGSLVVAGSGVAGDCRQRACYVGKGATSIVGLLLFRKRRRVVWAGVCWIDHGRRDLAMVAW